MTHQSGVHEKGTISLMDIIKDIKMKNDFRKAGAIATFTGVVRGENGGPNKVEKLTLEAYEEKANEVLQNICSDLKKKQGIVDVQVHHLLGEFSVGEDLVYVVVAGSHRQNVLPILEETVARYKKEAPIFKKEHTISNKGKKVAHWVSEKRSEPYG